MPEGHVIHRLARDLNSIFGGTAPIVSSPQGRFAHEASLVSGRGYTSAHAFGKHLFIEFDAPTPERIVYIHLGLIGKLALEGQDETWGQIRLHMADPQRADSPAANLRGPQWCKLITDAEMEIAIGKLGADPLRPDARPDSLRAKVARSGRSIGSLMMDQKLYAGVGNIYRAETLFRLGISPFTAGKDISDQEFNDIWDDLVPLMADGVAKGRIDTVRDEHLPEAMGREPRKDDHGGEVYVYRRAGLPCYVCGTPIATQVMEGRNLFWCPNCQS